MRAARYIDDEAEKTSSSQPELNLGLGSLLGIFFALAILCGLFFGVGYTLGHRGGATPQPTAAKSPETIQPSTTPGEAAPPTAPKPSAQIAAETSTSDLNPTAAKQVIVSDTPAQPTEASAQRPTTAVVALPKPASAEPATTPTGTIMVQIAAVAHSQDAEALAAALRKDGFAATVRGESQDHLLHVQVGPFANREEAKTMRQKLTGAGYNAFIK